MEEATVHCPHCKAPVTFPFGQVGRCPTCGGEVRVHAVGTGNEDEALKRLRSSVKIVERVGGEPSQPEPPVRKREEDERDLADEVRGRLMGPAIGLIVTSALSLLLIVLALLFDLWLLGSGVGAQINRRQGDMAEVTIMVRMGWSLLILVCNILSLVGGVKMLSLQGYSSARTGCILAVIPCVGPCFILGLPFGIWGLVVLNKPNVREAFTN
jgi:hypothetical protein